MRQDKNPFPVLLWTAMAVLFLFLIFQMRIMENIGHSPYVPWVAILLLLLQLVNHEQAMISLRKKSPNFTNHFYPENGRMIFGNMIASALVLEFNIFNYEHSRFNFSLELIGIPLLLLTIFLIENSQGGFLDFRRIYFPKKWDQIFKAYGVDILSVLIMISMWIPVIFQIPISAFLWIFLSTLLLKGSVSYTNKYNHVGWCFWLEMLVVLQVLTLGLQSSLLWLFGLGIIFGILFLAMYLPKMGYEKGLIAVAMLLFVSAMAGLYYIGHGRNTIVYYLQREIALLAGILFLTRLISMGYRKFLKKEKINKYSYAGAKEEKSFQMQDTKQTADAIRSAAKKTIHKKTILLKKAETVSEKPKIKAKKQVQNQAKMNSSKPKQTEDKERKVKTEVGSEKVLKPEIIDKEKKGKSDSKDRLNKTTATNQKLKSKPELIERKEKKNKPEISQEKLLATKPEITDSKKKEQCESKNLQKEETKKSQKLNLKSEPIIVKEQASNSKVEQNKGQDVKRKGKPQSSQKPKKKEKAEEKSKPIVPKKQSLKQIPQVTPLKTMQVQGSKKPELKQPAPKKWTSKKGIAKKSVSLKEEAKTGRQTLLNHKNQEKITDNSAGITIAKEKRNYFRKKRAKKLVK